MNAFCMLEPDMIVPHKIDGLYGRAAEAGLRWDDPDVGIARPVQAEIKVSERDETLPFLKDAATPFDSGS